MSLGLLMSSPPLTMWAYTNTTQWSVAWRSTFVPHQASLTTNQSLRETRNFTLVWLNLSTLHLQCCTWLGTYQQTVCVYLCRDSLTLLCAQQSSHCPDREQETVAGSQSLPTRSENPSAHLRGKQQKRLQADQSVHGWNVLAETGRMWQGSTNKQLEGSDSKQEDVKLKLTSCLGQWQ